MEFLPISFIAGILTILAPCVLPLLPVIIGGSLSENDKKRPLIITLSLAASIVIFTLLLKVSTLFIDIPQDFWKWFSAVIVFFFAISLLFPKAWPVFSLWFGKIIGQKEGLEQKSQKIISKVYNKKGILPSIILGAALGPVFASCSPTYFLILGTVLPASFPIGVLNLIVYALGLSLVMFLVAYAGQRFMKTLNLAANPNGWFKRGLGILFLIVALAIVTGYDKKLSTYILDKGFFDASKIEERILEKQNIIPNLSQEDNGQTIKESVLNVNKKAPDIKGLTNWINSSGYDSLSELHGKVVLVDFWTYSCVNCIRTLPYLQDLHEKYADKGLVILGVHAPEFQFEKKIENLKKAVLEYKLTYPIAQDNDFMTWHNFNNHYWPAKYLIDRNGMLRYYHYGEGDYDITEQAVVELLGAENKVELSETINDSKSFRNALQTPETYLGLRRRKDFVGINKEVLNKNQWTISENWEADNEKIYSSQLPVRLNMNFNAAEANLVMSGKATAEIKIDGKFYKKITIDTPRLYEIFKSKDGKYKEHKVEILFTGENIEAFAWTFGS